MADITNQLQAAAGAGGTTPKYIVVADNDTSTIIVYPWDDVTGVGSAYSSPATLAGQPRGVGFNPTATYVGVAHTNSPYVKVYPFNGTTGVGTAVSNPSTLPTGNGWDITWSPNGNDVAVSHDTDPYVTVYPWTGSGFGSKYADAATKTNTGARAVAFNPNGNVIGVVRPTGGGSIRAWPWTSGTGFGTVYTDPSATIGGGATGLSWSPNNSYVGVTNDTFGTNMNVFPWSNSTGFGSVYSDPATTPQRCRDIRWSYSNTVVAVASESSPYIFMYPWSGSGFGTKFSDPASVGSGRGENVYFSSDDSIIFLGGFGGIEAWEWNNSTGFGTKYTRITGTFLAMHYIEAA